MMDYLWMFFLGGIAVLSLVIFLITLSRDTFLVKKLKQKKSVLSVNFSLLLITLSSLGIIVYLFNLLRTQIEILQ